MIRELRTAIAVAEADPHLRLIVLRGEGGTFCSGGDLNWMKETLSYSDEENYDDAENLYALFESLDKCPIPVVGAVEGFALGGGVGLVSVCDYVIARRDAQFSLSEVRVGLVPACIGPFVLRKIGESHTRALFLSSERFSAERALHIDLIHEIAEDEAGLDQALDRVTQSILAASPKALTAAKEFIRSLTRTTPQSQGPLAVRTLADIRVTPEAQEGLRAFLEKRTPQWKKTQTVKATSPPVRFITAAALFDGHDAAIHIMRRVLVSEGAEVIHLGHDRSVADVVEAAIQEDVQGIAVSSYQGGHVEYFSYMVERLRERGCGHIRIYGGGGGVITPEEIALLHKRGVARIFTPEDGRTLGLEGMIRLMIRECSKTPVKPLARLPAKFTPADAPAIARALSTLERGAGAQDAGAG